MKTLDIHIRIGSKEDRGMRKQKINTAQNCHDREVCWCLTLRQTQPTELP